MPVKVIDASALAAVLFNEPDATKVVARIAGDSLVAPQLISFEVASVCLKKLRSRPDQHALLLDALQLVEQLDIDMAAVEFADVIGLAHSTGLTVYDACYLWLARLLNCDLVTLDKQLAAASKG